MALASSWQYSKQAWFMQTYIFISRHISWYIQTYILHTKAYCIAHAKHSYCTPVYKTRSSFELCHLCVRFHTVCSINTSDARNAQTVSTANSFCYSHMRVLLKWALHCKTHTWGPHWCTMLWCRVHSIKYGYHRGVGLEAHNCIWTNRCQKLK